MRKKANFKRHRLISTGHRVMQGAASGSASGRNGGTRRGEGERLILSAPQFAPAMSLRVNLLEEPDTETNASREIASVSARATEVFGSREKAMRWLYTPLSSFGNRTPISLISTTNGPAELEDTLGAIEHGIW